MTTVSLDAFFKPSFKNRPWHGSTTDDRSDEFLDGWLPSNHSTYRVCECKHAISNTPKGKNYTLKDKKSKGATACLRNGKWGARKTCFLNNGHWLVCSVHCGSILFKPHIGTVYSSILYLLSTTHSKDARLPWVILYNFAPNSLIHNILNKNEIYFSPQLTQLSLFLHQ